MYYIVNDRTYRNGILIMASLAFYAWGEPSGILILLISTFVSFTGAILAGKHRENIKGKLAMIVSVEINLLILIFLKYSDFLAETVNSLLGTSLEVYERSLPLGISFYTFKTISYIVDVYRGETEPRKSPFKLLLYVSLFHQVTVGPITRYNDIAEAIDNRVETAEDFNTGVSRFIIGLGKKAILAGIAEKSAEIFLYGDYSRLPLLGAWFGILMFALQLYFDFSGYSDMAIGLGYMFGFRYKENFNYPYISKSATEFWRRWHISLGSFFRDYVYIPLGGNRRHQVRNLLVVWFLTGLWHGAGWNYIAWGLYYFVLIVLEKAFLLKLFERIPGIFSRIYLWIATLVGWVFFSQNDIGQAFRYLGIMFGPEAKAISSPELSIYFRNNIVFLIIALIGCTPVAAGIYKRLKKKGETGKAMRFIDKFAKPAFNIAVLVLSVIFLAGQSYSPFMYFKF